MLLGGFQPVEEACEGGRFHLGGELLRGLAEAVDGAAPQGVAHTGGELDVEPEGLLGQHDEVGQGESQTGAHPPQTAGQSDRCAATGLAEPDIGESGCTSAGPGHPVCPSGSASLSVTGCGGLGEPAGLLPPRQGLDRLGEQWGVRLLPLRLIPAIADLLPRRTNLCSGQCRQGAQVGGADTRPGEQSQESITALGVGGHGQGGAHIGDLRHAQHAAEPDDLVGHAEVIQGVGDREELGASAAQDRHLRLRAPPLLHEVGDGARLRQRILDEGADDDALGQARGLGPFMELIDRDVGDLGVPGLRSVVAQW